MSNLPGLVVDVEARIDKLEKALRKANALQARSAGQMEDRAERSARRMRNSFEKAGDSSATAFDKIARGAAAARTPILAIGTAALAAAAALNRASENIAQIGDEARRAGVSATAFQEWGFVATQNRIGIDAMIDGLKEMNLRADEWISTGKGSAAEAFERLGFETGDLARRLKDPSELLLEIIGRLEGLDKAAQIRIADEIFGGQGGERFVELISQGEQGLRETIDRAHQLGIVLDDDVIDRAAEINRKFNELKAVTKTWVQGFIIDIADAAIELKDFRAKLDELFPNEAQGRAVLGNELYDGLDSNRDAVDAAATDISNLRAQYTGLADAAMQTAASLDQAAILARSYGYEEVSRDLADAGQEMRRLADEFHGGTLGGDEFAGTLDVVGQRADAAFGALDAADRVDFGNAISQVGRLSGAIAQAVSLAKALRAAILSAGATAGAATGPSRLQQFQQADAESRQTFEEFEAKQKKFLDGENERNAKSRETLEVEREIADVRERAGEAGAYISEQQARDAAIAKIAADALRDVRPEPPSKEKGGGGSARLDEFTRGAERIRELTRELDVERLALLAAAAAGGDYARAVDIAREKAELLNAALKSGRADTPGLRAEIDQLVGSWDAAAQATEGVQENLDELRSAQQAFENSLEDAFVGLVTGAKTFHEALSGILRQLASMAASRLFRQLFAGPVGQASGSFFSRLFGFSGGGYTGAGGTHEPAGIVHKGEFVMSARSVDRIGLQNLQALHAAGLRGYSAGGLVGRAPKLSAPIGDTSISISAPITVHGSAGSPEQNADLARRVSREIEHTLRGVVVDELQRQMRPGNLLNWR